MINPTTLPQPTDDRRFVIEQPGDYSHEKFQSLVTQFEDQQFNISGILLRADLAFQLKPNFDESPVDTMYGHKCMVHYNPNRPALEII